ncbi:TadE/TadG family type IV pilus assembly protein [Sphingomonas japonica]|uniref:Flp pilus assembly protein TadG n=1 Tax=Sphingomonas japonica TaxID=511662 RepID=A0ABX0TXK8_9SPHN|nr:TadE/TadG family type IV pilus assembly protein [Sphingomonas japonica]NIJ22963.1 Flp pilus assembly protein TadG [Sphingomonas japonica]
MAIRTFRTAAFGDRRAAALIEFAIAAPVLVLLLLGIVGYGQYFLLAHSAQQLANDAARVAIAGVTAQEREAIATAAVDDGGAALGIVDAENLTSVVREQSGRIEVDVAVDASDGAMFSVPIVPMPPSTIVRRAAARIGEAS